MMYKPRYMRHMISGIGQGEALRGSRSGELAVFETLIDDLTRIQRGALSRSHRARGGATEICRETLRVRLGTGAEFADLSSLD